MDAKSTRQYVADRIERDGWELPDALAYAKDRDKVEAFRSAYALYRLCSDETARADQAHRLIHRSMGVQSCIGWAGVQATGKSLGFSDFRIRYLVGQMDQESLAVEGLVGSGER